jgi:hypothetical protein
MSDRTMSLLFSTVDDGFEWHFCLSNTLLPWLCCISAEHSGAYEYDLASPYPLPALCVSADTNRAGSLRLSAGGFHRLLFGDILAESQHDTCIPTSHVLDYFYLSSRSSLPLGAFLWRTVLYYHARNGIAFSILTGRAGGLMII